MKPLKTFFVEPNLPERLSILKELAYNVRWSWNADTRELFRRIDSDLWESSGHNPVRMLGLVHGDRYLALMEDESFLYQLGKVQDEFKDYMKGDGAWFAKAHPEVKAPLTAYFSAEFGVADSLPIFSGGLGVLAGDHLKSASTMGVPIIGVGLAYQSGYFRQYLNPDGWQQETYPVNDFYTMPMLRVRAAEGQPLDVQVPFPGRLVAAHVWETAVGRSRLILLDTNHPDNQEGDRKITAQLYGGDQETRIQQEIVLGMGGIRALHAMGMLPPVLHSNEGHAAFLILERIRLFVKERGVNFDTAREATRGGVVFTTHTPVPAGIDVFPSPLVERYFGAYVRDVGIGMDQLLSIGRQNPSDLSSGFNMAVLAARLSYGTNAVSKLHRTTSRKMWRGLWPGVTLDEVPIGSVTNGIHIPSWISAEMGSLFDRYLGPGWRENPRDRVTWERIQSIPMEELWRTHERRRERLVAFARKKLHYRLKVHGSGNHKLDAALEVLDPEALTIGFARRFAPYKRANLLLRDHDRLARILSDRKRPVQLLVAGKAHPRDHLGKELIRKLYVASREPELANRIAFLEDYDLNIARYLVQGVDVWLNTPRRPKEASGTSGMKAVANGALHLSTKDGWWAEVNAEGLGWTIGGGEEYTEDQHEYADEVESRALYDLLEHELVPLFYQRGRDDLPRGWLRMMKKSLTELCPVFNSNRMVREYTERYYLPAFQHQATLIANDLDGARKLADWKRLIAGNWGAVRLDRFEVDIAGEVRVGDTGEIRAWLHLAPLLPQDIAIEVVFGRIGPDSAIEEEGAVPMQYISTGDTDHLSLFRGVVPCLSGGKLGFAIRILPRHRDLPNPYQMGLVHVIEG